MVTYTQNFNEIDVMRITILLSHHNRLLEAAESEELESFGISPQSTVYLFLISPIILVH